VSLDSETLTPNPIGQPLAKGTVVTDFVGTFVPVVLFMLIPVWIPLGTAAVGSLLDLVRREEVPTGAFATTQRILARKTHLSFGAVPGVDHGF
jgi:hypothetical protein